jgi:ABC-type Fe3+-hydroxamate transport system substrate-binding protein
MRKPIVLTLAAAAVLVTGCSSSADETSAGAPSSSSAAVASTTPAAPTTTTPTTAAETTTAQAAADPAKWIAAYRTAYPALAEGRSDNGIANDGDRVCDYLAEPGMTLDLFQRRMSMALERNGTTPSPADITKIAQLGVDSLCPAQQPALDSLA